MMSTTEALEEIKAIRVLPFSGLQQDWDEWSAKYQGIAAERGYLQKLCWAKKMCQQMH